MELTGLQMRFSIQPEPRPEQNMRTVTIDEIVSACEYDPGSKPTLEYYFSPTKKESFIKGFLHYINTGLLEAKHGNLEKELGLFYRILQKNL